MMLKCKVCGKEFEATTKGHYIARDNIKQGAVTVLSSEEENLFDAFDCPHCGCQLIVQGRKRQFEEKDQKIILKGDEEREKNNSLPLCFGTYCAYMEKCCGCEWKMDCVSQMVERTTERKGNKNEK